MSENSKKGTENVLNSSFSARFWVAGLELWPPTLMLWFMGFPDKVGLSSSQF